MSHIEIRNLAKIINFIRKYNSKTPICIDTEGAQIRTKVDIKKFIKKNTIFKLFKKKSSFNLYPNEVYEKLKKNDVLSIGFDNLKACITKKTKNYCLLKSISSGLLEANKGVHLVNRKIELSYLTEKDLQAIEIGKRFKIKNYALSFTNNHNDVKNFKKKLITENKIYKIETLSAIKDLKKILRYGENFLIDRGDLSKETEIHKIPFFQRKIIRESKKLKHKKVFVATNLLESMIINNYPTRAEANDIYNCLELGASGLVLAAETAVGNYPENSILFLNKMIKEFYKKN
tara:strand:+ start:20 stop:886 length:867 start_codon:yes stop_codon:yes gene_type:complete